ncbi:ScbA/BarX family gamma-butyrolactone biosynthesis protein [Kitasatospora sp. NBC_00458]|uniref:ScbA/BarX family gamma-butyrolactone biosynthesis protein n=1 Tax=Kitasatospora sp. NBC_00458 TaxID=2903568 RepID=UPI002E16D3D9
MNVLSSVVPGRRRPLLREGWNGLRFDRHLPREAVHKHADSEVLLTDAVRLEEERFAVAALWLRDHHLGRRGGPASDPVMLAETVRQTAIHLAHRFHGSTYGNPFVLSDLAVDLDEALPPTGPDGLDVGLDLRCPPAAARPGRERFAMEGVAWAGHRPVGRVRMRWEVLEADRYELIRRRSAGAAADPEAAPDVFVPVDPRRVGQTADRDVLVAADPARPDRWWLRPFEDHPVLFDHPVDHVPGMVLMEAFRQAAAAAFATGTAPGAAASAAVFGPADAIAELRGIATGFTAFGELPTPVAIVVEPADGGAAGVTGPAGVTGAGGPADPAGTVRLTAVQDGRPVAFARVRRTAAADPASAGRGVADPASAGRAVRAGGLGTERTAPGAVGGQGTGPYGAGPHGTEGTAC